MGAPTNNKNAAKQIEDLETIIPLYVEHIASGFSKESFIEADYRTIEKYLKDEVVLQPLKIALEKAHRAALKHWEQIGMDITTGKVRGNPATWIFTMKNKFPDLYKDRQEISHEFPQDSELLLKARRRAEDIASEGKE